MNDKHLFSKQEWTEQSGAEEHTTIQLGVGVGVQHNLGRPGQSRAATSTLPVLIMTQASSSSSPPTSSSSSFQLSNQLTSPTLRKVDCFCHVTTVGSWQSFISYPNSLTANFTHSLPPSVSAENNLLQQRQQLLKWQTRPFCIPVKIDFWFNSRKKKYWRQSSTVSERMFRLKYDRSFAEADDDDDDLSA